MKHMRARQLCWCNIFTRELNIFKGLFFLFALVSLFLFAHDAYAANEDAAEIRRLYLDAATITKGYTVETYEKDFKVGVVDRAVTVPVEVVFKDIPASHIPVAKTDERISRIVEYDIRHDAGSITESLGILEKPIYIALRYNSENTYKKVLHFWDKPTQRWVPLPTTVDIDNKLARAVIHFPYARLAVFEKGEVFEGSASWYSSGYSCYCGASHIYKRGTILKVTNIEPLSPKYGTALEVRVNDYGPDPDIHPDRPIDLDKPAFAYLAASLGSGLLKVRIEPVDPLNAERYTGVLLPTALKQVADALTETTEPETSQTIVQNESLIENKNELSTEEGLAIGSLVLVDENNIGIRKEDIYFLE